MATTTNYSWSTPDDTALVKDGAAAIRTLGSSADTTVKALNPGTTAGDIDYYTTSTAKARVGIGTAGQVLRVNSGATAPEWFTPAGGGKVLQVVQATYSTATTIASTSFTDTGLSATITPTLATSKILILVTQQVSLFRDSGAIASGFQILRGVTAIAERPSPSAQGVASTASTPRLRGGYALNYLDSPATTSSTTYKTQARVDTTANTGEMVLQADSSISTMILLEIGA